MVMSLDYSVIDGKSKWKETDCNESILFLQSSQKSITVRMCQDSSKGLRRNAYMREPFHESDLKA